MRNLTMMTDLYQLTMMYGYYKHGMRDNLATFDMFYRSKDATTHYAIAAGLEQLIDYIRNLRFTEDDVAYLRSSTSLTRISSKLFTISVSAAISGRYRKEPSYSPMNL